MHSVYVSSFWGLCPQTPTGALPLDPAGGLPSPDPVLFPLSKFLATPLPIWSNEQIDQMRLTHILIANPFSS